MNTYKVQIKENKFNSICGEFKVKANSEIEARAIISITKYPNLSIYKVTELL